MVKKSHSSPRKKLTPAQQKRIRGGAAGREEVYYTITLTDSTVGRSPASPSLKLP